MGDEFSQTVSLNRASSITIVNRRTRGGMAEIFLAVDGAGHQVIVRKLRKEHRFNLRLRRRFHQGIEMRRKMGRHPNMVQYISQAGGLRPYEVIEYVPGDSLKAMIVNKHRLVQEQPFMLLRPAIWAVSHVHERGYLHLDVKPENFLVEYVGEGCRVKLTDFDFCQPITTTQVHRKFGGSLMYEPPEFLSNKTVSPRTDLFALGVLGYYLFSYHMPFVESSHDLLKNKSGNIVQFSASNPRLSQPVQNFLMQAIQPQPENRFARGEAMLAALDAAETEHRSRLEAPRPPRPPRVLGN